MYHTFARDSPETRGSQDFLPAGRGIKTESVLEFKLRKLEDYRQAKVDPDPGIHPVDQNKRLMDLETVLEELHDTVSLLAEAFLGQAVILEVLLERNPSNGKSSGR